MACLKQTAFAFLFFLLFSIQPSYAQYESYSIREPVMSGLRSVRDFFLQKVTKQSSCGISFKTSSLGGPSGGIKKPTCIAIGHDQRLYIGTLGGTVEVVSYNRDSGKATAKCSSGKINNPEYKGPRSVLGIAIDPRDKTIRPYVSTSTPGFKKRVNSNKQTAWQNGAVVRFIASSSTSGQCLKFDKRVVSGLPVSNGDKGIHALLFAQNGNLLIAVPGVTNMGLPGKNIGGIWESPLSAAILSASVAKGGFNGKVTYSGGGQPFTAKKSGGNVQLYATGLRNCFTMTMGSGGQIYGVDQGSNCNYGNAATSCDNFNLAKALAFDKGGPADWPGKTFSGCPGAGTGRKDKLVQIIPGKFYGHPNLNRGGKECKWIDPNNNKDASGGPPPSGYKSAITLITSSATGIHQYRGNHFCGNMRGDLLVSSYNKGYLLRMGGGKISGSGDIALAENAHGDLLIPQFGGGGVKILKASGGGKSGLFIAGVSPFRHGGGGGTPITIGGSNFGSSPKVEIGGKTCAVKKSSSSEITCIVPSHSGGPKSLEVSASGDSKTLKNAVLYM